MQLSSILSRALAPALFIVVALLPSPSAGAIDLGTSYRFVLSGGGEILIDFGNPAIAQSDTIIALPGVVYTMSTSTYIGVSTESPLSFPRVLSFRSRTTVNFISTSPPVFYDGGLVYDANAEARGGGYSSEIFGDQLIMNDPSSFEITGAAHHNSFEDTESRANVFLSNTTTDRFIEVDTASRVSCSADTGHHARAYARTLRNYTFSMGDTTTILAHSVPTMDDCETGEPAPGLASCNPIFPINTTPPYVFPTIPSDYWFDPPTTYGYRYEISDALVVAVTGWTTYLAGPVRVSVGNVDLGFFEQDENLVFSNYAGQLGDLLIAGIGVSSFEVTEITPRTHGGDPMAFPIRLEYSDLATSTLVMTPINEPDISSVESESVLPWAKVVASASPNPFNPAVSVQYSLQHSTRVSVSVYDLKGRIVRSLISGEQQSEGSHTLTWRGDGNTGHSLASGVYIVQIDAGEKQGTVRVTLLK